MSPLDRIAQLTAQLARSTRKAHARKARAFIAENPGCADNSNYWRGLSARQVISTASAAYLAGECGPDGGKRKG